MLKSLYRSQKLQLYRLGERRGHSLQIQFLRVESARLNKKLMAFFIGEVHNFVFKARAVARPHAVNFSAVKRRILYVIENNLFCFVICIRYIASRLVYGRSVGVKRKRSCCFVALLLFKHRKSTLRRFTRDGVPVLNRLSGIFIL